MASNKVLIVDAHSETRTQIREMLPGGKFEIVEALDGEEARLLFDLEQKTLRLVIFNFDLSSGEGWELLKTLQTDETLQKIPVVLYAAAGDRVRDIVPDPYFNYVEAIALPCDRKTFQQAVKAALAKAKRPRQPLPLDPKTAPQAPDLAASPPSPETVSAASDPKATPIADPFVTPAPKPEIAPEAPPSDREIETVQTDETAPSEAVFAAVAEASETDNDGFVAADADINAATPALYTPYDRFECCYTIGSVDCWNMSCLAIALDGETMISASESDQIKLWNLYDGASLGQWSLLSKDITAIAIAPDGQTLLSGAKTTNIKRWNITTGELLAPFNEDSMGIASIAISLDNQTVITASYSSNIKLWDFATGQLLGPLNDQSFGTTALALSPDQQTLITGSDTTNIKLWDVATGELLGPLNIASTQVTSLVVSPDGRLAISGHRNGTIQFTDLYSGETLRSIKAHPQAITGLDIRFDGQVLVSACDREFKVWGAFS